jgi:Peptidase family M1 domain
VVEPNRYIGGFTLQSLAWGNGEAITGYALDGVELRIPLAVPLPDGESVTLALTYETILPNQNAPFGYTERQANLGDWYPYVPPYVLEDGWLVREDAFYGEHLAYDVADFEVEIRLARPASASGRPLTIAASSLPVPEGEVSRYRHGPARNFAWTVSDQYQVSATEAGGITVKSYAFPSHPLADGPALEETAKALSLYNGLFSPYPHPALSVVEADFLDGMEFDGLIFLSHAFYDFFTGDQKSNLTIIAAHEVAHQWWYGYVGNDQALEPWLDESLATFSELYFFENTYPDLVDWYWENRVTFHAPQGWVDGTIYDAAGFYPYRDAVYLRGAMFLKDLRDLMGEEAFLEFLRDYLRQYSYRQANSGGFFALLSEHTQADLSGLIGTYFANR